MQPPLYLHSKYYKDFIRGYFDGDGSISYHKDNINHFSWEIVGASKPMIEWIRTILATQYKIINNGVISTTLDTGVQMYKTSYCNKLMLERIYNTLYYPNCLCLQRKKEKIETILK